MRSLRVKDVDFACARNHGARWKRSERSGYDVAGKPRGALQRHLDRMKAQHEQDVTMASGRLICLTLWRGSFRMRNENGAGQYVFPSSRLAIDPRCESPGSESRKRRHHVAESALQLAMKKAVRASGVNKPASCHTTAPLLRHAFARERLRHSHRAGTSWT